MQSLNQSRIGLLLIMLAVLLSFTTAGAYFFEIQNLSDSKLVGTDSSKKVHLNMSADEKAMATGVNIRSEFVSPISIETNVSVVSVGQILQLHAFNSGNWPLVYEWNLGDGRTVLNQTVEVEYSSPSQYTIVLTGHDRDQSYTDSLDIEVIRKPAANFILNETVIGIDETLVLTHTGGGLAPLTHLWEFGDSTTSTELSPTHTFDAAGRYKINHVVHNEFGSDQETEWVEVRERPELIIFLPPNAIVGSAWNAYVTLEDEQTADIFWRIEPVQSEGEQEPVELTGMSIQPTFAEPGRYRVVVQATNRFGVDEEQWLINVMDSKPQEILSQADKVIGVLPESYILPHPPTEITSPTLLLLFYINAARKAAGVLPVSLVPALSKASQVHTDDMARHNFTSHTGFDESSPLERVARSGYNRGGFVGEVTAWGFDDPRDAVAFWLGSPSHKPTILSELADQIGVAQTVNFDADSVWYWVAEFGSSHLSIEGQVASSGIRLISPTEASSYRIDQVNDQAEKLDFSWIWPLPLANGDRFVISLLDVDGDTVRLGGIAEPSHKGQPFAYRLSVDPIDLDGLTGRYDWIVSLVGKDGAVRAQSFLRSLQISGVYPMPTPVPTLLPESQTPAP